MASVHSQELIDAVEVGDFAAAQKALAAGGDPLWVDEYGHDALCHALRDVKVDLILLLCKHCARHSKAKNRALRCAIAVDSPELMDRALELDGDINADFTTPLWYAISLDRPDYARLLLVHGADPDIRRDDEETDREFAHRMYDQDQDDLSAACLVATMPICKPAK